MSIDSTNCKCDNSYSQEQRDSMKVKIKHVCQKVKHEDIFIDEI